MITYPKSTSIVMAIATSIGLLCVAPATTQVGPVELIAQVSEDVQGHLEDDAERIRTDAGYLLELIERILLPHIDTDLVTRLVLGASWNTATQEQRDRFAEEFTRYLERFYARVFLIYTGESIDIEHVAVSDPSLDDDQSMVESRLQSERGEPVTVRYRLRRSQGGWLVYDFSIDGVGLVETNRAQFSSLIARDGLTAVTNTLAARNARPFR